MKPSYKFIPSNGYVLIHYVGNERAACEFTHRNSKHHMDRQYTRTCPPVPHSAENKCAVSSTAKVYRKNINKIPTTHMPVLHARNSQQVENLWNKKLSKQRISHDSLYSTCITLYMPEFVQKTTPTLIYFAYVDKKQSWTGSPSKVPLSSALVQWHNLSAWRFLCLSFHISSHTIQKVASHAH